MMNSTHFICSTIELCQLNSSERITKNVITPIITITKGSMRYSQAHLFICTSILLWNCYVQCNKQVWCSCSSIAWPVLSHMGSVCTRKRMLYSHLLLFRLFILRANSKPIKKWNCSCSYCSKIVFVSLACDLWNEMCPSGWVWVLYAHQQEEKRNNNKKQKKDTATILLVCLVKIYKCQVSHNLN